jgi:hypothetical protein
MVFQSSALSQSTSVPAEAIKAAQDFLDYSKDRAKEDPNWFANRWKVNVKTPERLELGGPVRLYIVDKENISKVAENGDLFNVARLRGFNFPVFDETNFIGMIRVVELNGKWQFVGRSFSTNPINRRALEIQKDYTTDNSYNIAVLSERTLGAFIIVIHNENPRYAMPAMKRAADLLSIQGTAIDEYPLLEYDEFKTKIKNHAEIVERARKEN